MGPGARCSTSTATSRLTPGGGPRARPAGADASRMRGALVLPAARIGRVGGSKGVAEARKCRKPPRVSNPGGLPDQLLLFPSKGGDEIRGPLGSTLLLLARIERQRGGGHAAESRLRATDTTAKVVRGLPRIGGSGGHAEAGPASFLRMTDRGRTRERRSCRQLDAKGGEHGGTSRVASIQTRPMRAPFKL
jgi:hypothetical protein